MVRRRVEVLGVPFNSAGSTTGVARGPAALREAGLVEALRGTGAEVVDRGDVTLGSTDPGRDAGTGLIAPDALTGMILAIRVAVDGIIATGGLPFVIGGDCPILLGCLGAGAQANAPGLLFVDGHEDAWPPRQSTTGEAADMELGLALGRHLEGLPDELVAALPRLDPERVLVVGARDQAELADAGVPSLDGTVEIIRVPALATKDPHSMGVELASRLSRMGPWWLHVDLDVLSTDSLGAVDYPQPGGIDWDVLTGLTRGALASPGVLGWVVTIYNPELDPTGRDATRIVRYVAEAIGD